MLLKLFTVVITFNLFCVAQAQVPDPRGRPCTYHDAGQEIEKVYLKTYEGELMIRMRFLGPLPDLFFARANLNIDPVSGKEIQSLDGSYYQFGSKGSSDGPLDLKVTAKSFLIVDYPEGGLDIEWHENGKTRVLNCKISK